MTKKLEPEQKRLMYEVRDAWIDLIFNNNDPIDKEEARKGIEWLYSLGELDKPLTVFTGSPIACQIAANILYACYKISQQVSTSDGETATLPCKLIWRNIRDTINDPIWGQVENYGGYSLSGMVINNTLLNSDIDSNAKKAIGDRLNTKIEYEMWKKVMSQVRDQVWNQVPNSEHRNEVDEALRLLMRGIESASWEVNKVQPKGDKKSNDFIYFYPTDLTLFSEASYGAFYDFFTRIGIVKNENNERYLNYLRSGVCYGIFLDKVAIVCGRPEYIKRDNNLRLHSEDGPAILWPDGYAQYCWHGLPIDKKIIEHPEDVTKEDLIKETNVEIRRAIREKLGSGRFAQLLDLEEVDRDWVGQGVYKKEYTLLRSKEPDEVAGEKIQFVNVMCHSTEREYMLCVPPDINDVWSAVAWTFDRDKEDYIPDIET